MTRGRLVRADEVNPLDLVDIDQSPGLRRSGLVGWHYVHETRRRDDDKVVIRCVWGHTIPAVDPSAEVYLVEELA